MEPAKPECDAVCSEQPEFVEPEWESTTDEAVPSEVMSLDAVACEETAWETPHVEEPQPEHCEDDFPCEEPYLERPLGDDVPADDAVPIPEEVVTESIVERGRGRRHSLGVPAW